MSIPAELRTIIRALANDCCESCRMSEQANTVEYHIDHIIPVSRNGKDGIDNLCLACAHCNRHKGSNAAAIDPVTDEAVKLFNPRKQIWTDHFQFETSGTIIGLTPEGRVTVEVLQVNKDVLKASRQRLIRAKLYPC